MKFVTPFFCYVFQSSCLCTALLCFCHCRPHCYFPVLYSGHKTFPFSSFDTFFPMIVFSLLHLTYSILLLPFFLCFHASKYLPHHRFLSCFPVINSCPQFSSILCYKSSRKKRVSHVFEHLISNIKSHNGVKI